MVDLPFWRAQWAASASTIRHRDWLAALPSDVTPAAAVEQCPEFRWVVEACVGAGVDLMLVPADLMSTAFLRAYREAEFRLRRGPAESYRRWTYALSAVGPEERRVALDAALRPVLAAALGVPRG